MSEGDEFREGYGLPRINLSERGRQAFAFLVVILSISAAQIGLIQLLPSLVLPTTRDKFDHAILLSRIPGGDSVLPPTDHLVSLVTGSTVILTSAFGVLAGVLSRTHNRRKRKQAVYVGYLYLLAEIGAVSLLSYYISQQKPDRAADIRLEKQYRDAFASAMWDYLYDLDLKQYIDAVQQEYGCCGAYRFSDWYTTDWLRPQLYANKYYMMLTKRRKLAKDRGEAWYDIGHYGMPSTQRRLVPLLVNEEDTWPRQCGLYVNEVPFSCCNPESPTYCRQMFANRKQFNFHPDPGTGNNTLHVEGCASRVVGSLLSRHRDPIYPPMWAPLAVKVVAFVLYRLLQTSAASGLAAGRHLSPAPGWVFILRPTRGQASSSKPLMDGETSDDESDATDSTPPQPPDDDDDDDEDDDDDDGDGDEDDAPPPPSMD